MSNCPFCKKQIVVFNDCLLVCGYKSGVIVRQLGVNFWVLLLILFDLFFQFLFLLSVVFDYWFFQLFLQVVNFLLERVFIWLVKSSEMFTQSLFILFHALHASFKLRVVPQKISQVFFQLFVSDFGKFFRHNVSNLSLCLFKLGIVVRKSSNRDLPSWNLIGFWINFFGNGFVFVEVEKMFDRSYGDLIRD